MSLSAHARLTISDDDRDLPGAFGGGCASLLEGVAEEGSLNRAAKRMGMAYSKAWRIVREAEGHLGCELLARDGARGSVLTPEGEHALHAYRTLQAELDAMIAKRLTELFSHLGHERPPGKSSDRATTTPKTP